MHKKVICAGILFLLGMQAFVMAQYRPPHTVVGRNILTRTPIIWKLIADTSFAIGVGVEETDLQYLNSKGQPMQVFILRADPPDH